MFGSKSFISYRRKELTPDITPLIDVVFLLLIFFMVATTFNNNGGIKVELPKSSINEVEKTNEKITVFISKELEYMVVAEGIGRKEEFKVNSEELRTKMAELIPTLQKKNVAISADGQVPHKVIIEVMTILKENGAEGMDIETEKE